MHAPPDMKSAGCDFRGPGARERNLRAISRAFPVRPFPPFPAETLRRQVRISYPGYGRQRRLPQSMGAEAQRGVPLRSYGKGDRWHEACDAPSLREGKGLIADWRLGGRSRALEIEQPPGSRSAWIYPG